MITCKVCKHCAYVIENKVKKYRCMLHLFETTLKATCDYVDDNSELKKAVGYRMTK